MNFNNFLIVYSCSVILSNRVTCTIKKIIVTIHIFSNFVRWYLNPYRVGVLPGIIHLVRTQSFQKIEHFLPPDTHTYMFFGKFCLRTKWKILVWEPAVHKYSENFEMFTDFFLILQNLSLQPFYRTSPRVCFLLSTSDYYNGGLFWTLSNIDLW